MRQMFNLGNEPSPALENCASFSEISVVAQTEAPRAFRHQSPLKLGSFRYFSEPSAADPLKLASFPPVVVQPQAPVANFTTGTPKIGFVPSSLRRPAQLASFLHFPVSASTPRPRASPIGFVSTKPHSRFCYNDSFRPDIAGFRYVP